MTEKSRINFPQGIRMLLILASIGIVALAMREAASIINSIALALILSISMTPILNWLIRRGIPRGLALLIVTFVVVAVVVMMVVIVVVSLENVANTLPEYQDRFNSLIDDATQGLEKLGIDSTDIRSLDAFSASNLVDIGVTMAGALAGALSSWFFMLLLATYMLIEAIDLPAKIEKTLKAGSGMPARFYSFNVAIRSYIFMTVWIGALTSVLMTILLLILGVDFALLWGILAFLMSFVPYVGFVIALVPPTVMGLLESGWTTALAVVIGFIIVNTLTDNILKPKIMGKGLDLSPLVIMLSLFVWAWILGPVGALLAVPLTIMVKELFLEAGKDTKWLANLMMPLDSIPESSGED